MRTAILATLFLITPLSLAKVSTVLLLDSAQNLYGSPDAESALDPEESLDAIEPFPIGMGAKSEMERAVLIAQSTSSFTDFGGGHFAYAYPVKFKEALPATDLQVNGYMIKPKRGKKYILYPIITAFDDEKKLLATLLPNSESDIRGNTIENTFSVPDGTRYLLIHADPRLVTLDMETGDSLETASVSAGLASLGGAIGGIFNGVLLNSQVQRGRVGVAPVGIAEVMQVDP